MSSFIIAAGHTASGNIGCGVIDRLNESDCTRIIGALVSQYLQDKGHGVNLLRIDKGNSYNCEDCCERTNEANEIEKSLEVELYLEIHINAGEGTGPEVLVTCQSEVANQYAAKVSNALAGALNLPNRGVKTRNPIVSGLVGADDFSDVEWKLGWNRNDIGWWYCTSGENKYYYISKDGSQEIGGEWYKFNDRGYALKDTWYYDEKDNTWYYLDESCKMVRGTKDKLLWKWINGKCYAFGEDGKMYSNCVTPDGFKVDGFGAWIK